MTTVQQKAAAEAVGWVWANVARPLKFVFMWFAFMGSIGHMGRALIEGLDWWVKIVDLYHRIMNPVAGVLESLLKAPILWVASWFDIAVNLPEFPIWGIDIIVLANIAAGFLVFKRFLSIPSQIFVAATIIVSLAMAVYGFTDTFVSERTILRISGFLALGFTGLYLLWRSVKVQIFVQAVSYMTASAEKMDRDYGQITPQKNLVFVLIRYFYPRMHYSYVRGKIWMKDGFKAGSIVKAREDLVVFDEDYPGEYYIRVAAWRSLLTYATIFAVGFLVLLLNSYADQTLPILTRFAAAWDAMILEKVLQPLGLG